MVIGIYANPERDTGLTLTGKFVGLLRERGIEFCCGESLGGAFGESVSDRALVGRADVIVVFGGDGTALSVAVRAARAGKPLCAVNAGRLGFLTSAERGDLESVAAALKAGKFTLDKRAVLEVGFKGEKFYALNESALMKEGHSSVKIEAYNGGKYIETFIADGVMVSTPTGSTAYALSCGGSVLSPELNALELVAVAPHSLMRRPVVFPDTDKITLRALSRGCVSVNDGVETAKIGAGEEIVISKAKFTASFTRFKDYDFYGRLKSKINDIAVGG